MLRLITKEEFKRSITENPKDKFAKTFISKCDMIEGWGSCYGFVENGEVCGAIVTTFSKKLPKCANLQLLHVFAKHRRKGIATKLCLASIELAVNNHCDYYRVSSEPDAVLFYESLGIRFWGKQKSGCQLSLFKLNGPRFTDGIYEQSDEFINKKLFSKAKGGLVELFE